MFCVSVCLIRLNICPSVRLFVQVRHPVPHTGLSWSFASNTSAFVNIANWSRFWPLNVADKHNKVTFGASSVLGDDDEKEDEADDWQ